MNFPRSTGVVLHPTSLDGGHGIGDLGAGAHRFIEFLAAAGARYWQILPLGPTGYGDSPYQCFSAFAGNHLVISLDTLAAEGAIDRAQLPAGREGSVDFGRVVVEKLALLRRAFEGFDARAPARTRARLEAFARDEGARPWLDDYALFRALKEEAGGASWFSWDQDLVLRRPRALREARRRLRREVLFHEWLQFVFFEQWARVKERASDRGISIIGDVPIFVALDSADTWSNSDLFLLDADRRPVAVAGVPPDYFSPTGQLWGNPLYDWKRMEQRGFRWWIDRLRAVLDCVDVVRLDHFRGFEACWSVPADCDTAVGGRWVKAPGSPLFDALRGSIGVLPFIAEDLGVITPEVDTLRRRMGFPGMRVLQFAFSGEADNPYLPTNFERNTVVYSGTHDNDTTLGWWRSLDPGGRKAVEEVFPGVGADMPWSLIDIALASVADLAIVPVQDILGLGPGARMNHPGRAAGNWCWRLDPGALRPELAERLRGLVERTGRAAGTASTSAASPRRRTITRVDAAP